jgi:hypothetical protein
VVVRKGVLEHQGTCLALSGVGFHSGLEPGVLPQVFSLLCFPSGHEQGARLWDGVPPSGVLAAV